MDVETISYLIISHLNNNPSLWKSLLAEKGARCFRAHYLYISDANCDIVTVEDAGISIEICNKLLLITKKNTTPIILLILIHHMPTDTT